ncbi:conserved hypothetical protein [Leishmania mexicana MHOM/GT/2001/U1103]|uniref:RNA-editing substrate-binding complex 6 protein domain-containing protein n=1 Tax=Leishmania mexicana (strain MHOM/GT/2001/U1103) TaxID=929439 RepID=E9AZJ5_LEIMU|nr:conserved hypothetical protein [Leishmania mexicana MHOM/GT/2001/U1103]CBZ28395.1 conserved hypothetical protein [Leishmania mexicana MHOM/GT/2001/U1103]
MSAAVTQLVRRLTVPAVATSLMKEELCLALAAVAQLRPSLSTATDGGTTTSPLSTETLARRSLRVLPRCAPQEVRMIAHGASALQWFSTPSLPVIDALARTLYTHTVKLNRSGTGAKTAATHKVRLSDILAVVQLAAEAQRYFDATIFLLATQHAVEVGAQSTSMSTAVAEEFVAVVCGYAGEVDGAAAVERLTARLEASPAVASNSPGLAVLKACVRGRPLKVADRWAVPYARWAQQRRNILETLRTTGDAAAPTHTADGPARTPIQLLRARYDAWQVALTLLTDEEEVADDRLQRTLESVRVFHIQDPVMLSTLDREVSLRVVSSALPSVVFANYENCVYAQAQHYPQALAALKQRDADASAAVTGAREATSSSSRPPAAEALQRVSVIRRVYNDAVAGAVISEKDLFQIATVMDTSSADEVAMATYVLARVKEVPTTILTLLQKHSMSLTAEGVVALVRAGRHDRRGALSTVLPECLRRSAHLQECIVSAPTTVLVRLAEALGRPVSRWTAPSEQMGALEEQVVDMVVAHLLPQVEQMPLPALLSVMTIGGCHLAGTDDLMQAVCSRVADHLVAAVTPPSIALCLEVLAALHSGDSRQERLLDALADAIAEYFAPLLQLTISADASCLAALLRFATIQVKYGSPETAAVGTGLVQRVRQGGWGALPPEMLVAAALFALDSSTLVSSATSLDLPHAVVAHLVAAQGLSSIMTVDLAIALVQLLEVIPTVDADNAQALVTCVLPVASALSPLVIARLLALRHRSSAAAATPSAEVAAEHYNTVSRHVLGLPPDTFTALCLVAARPGFDTALANLLVDVLPLMADALSAHQLSQCVFGLGEMADAGQRLSHQVMTEALSDYAVDNLELFTSAPDIADLLHGFAKLQCTKRNLYSVFSTQLLRRPVIATLEFRSISLLFFAFGSVRFVNKDLMDILCRTFIVHIDSLAAPDVLMSLRGLSRMSLLNAAFYRKLGMKAIELIDAFPLQAQCDLLHAYGAVEEAHSELAATLSRRIAAEVESLPSVSVATDVLTSLWLMGANMTINEDIERIVDYVVRHASELTGPDMMKLCSITLNQNWRQPQLLHGMATRAIELQKEEQLEPTTARAVLDTLSSQLVFHQAARVHLSQLARTVSKETVLLSGEEQEQLNLITSH